MGCVDGKCFCLQSENEILIISAAGSEMSDSTVLTNEEKTGFNSDIVRSKFAIPTVHQPTYIRESLIELISVRTAATQFECYISC